MLEVQAKWLRMLMHRLLAQNGISLSRQLSKLAIEQAPQVQHVLLLTVCVLTSRLCMQPGDS